MSASKRSVISRVGFVLLSAAALYCIYAGLGAGFAAYHYSRARVLLGEDRVAAAVVCLEEARSWTPEHVGARWLLARNALGLGNHDEARALLESLADDGPYSLPCLDARARLAEESGKPDEARRLFARICELHPGQVAGPLGLARLGDPTLLQEMLAQLPPSPTTRSAASKIFRGVALLHLEDEIGTSGYGTPDAAQSLLEARRSGANAVSVRVPGRQKSIFEPRITFAQGQPGSERDEEVVRTIRDAHLLGMKVLLKPHIMLGRLTDAEWRGTLSFEDESEKQARWWKDYRQFILHYARLAEREKVEVFCVGAELRGMVRTCPDHWRDLITAVRVEYTRAITYAANWYHEYEEVPFWNAVDLIGLQFFFPLSASEHPTSEELRDGITPILANLDELAWGYDRPVILTEVGYKSTPGGAHEPWVWATDEIVPDLELQERAYRAIFEAFQDLPWCHGMFWWNWLTTPVPDEKFRPDFTPQGKPAQRVLEEGWLGK